MGTRAIIEKGKIFIATHWDGDPDSLGMDLVNSGGNIIEAAQVHSIDSINKKEYGDFAEYQYVIKGNKVFYRALNGEYPKSLKKAKALKYLGTMKNGY